MEYFLRGKISKDTTGSGERKNKIVTPRILNEVIGKMQYVHILELES